MKDPIEEYMDKSKELQEQAFKLAKVSQLVQKLQEAKELAGEVKKEIDGLDPGIDPANYVPLSNMEQKKEMDIKEKAKEYIRFVKKVEFNGETIGQGIAMAMIQARYPRITMGQMLDVLDDLVRRKEIQAT